MSSPRATKLRICDVFTRERMTQLGFHVSNATVIANLCANYRIETIGALRKEIHRPVYHIFRGIKTKEIITAVLGQLGLTLAAKK